MKNTTLNRYAAIKAAGEKQIYFCSIDDIDLLFRPMSFNEFEIMLQMSDHIHDVYINEYVVRVTNLYCEIPIHEWLDVSIASRVDYLAKAIIELSAFGTPKLFLDQIKKSRESSNNIHSIIVKHICAAFPRYTPDEIAAMTMNEQSRLVALAEDMLNQKIPFEAMLNPKENQHRRPKLPVPDGYSSTDPQDIKDIMNPANASVPDFEKIRAGTHEVY